MHPYEDYRDFYASRASLGGGVILDRTHELDYLRWMFGEVTDGTCLHAKRSDLDIDTEDVAEMLVRFKSGVIGAIHLDFLQAEYRCVARVVGDRGVIEWSFNPQLVRAYAHASGGWKTLLDHPEPDVNEMYVEEIRYFLEAVAKGGPTCNDLAEGKKLIELLLSLRQAPRPTPAA
jgi:predicted dehydrogenase